MSDCSASLFHIPQKSKERSFPSDNYILEDLEKVVLYDELEQRYQQLEQVSKQMLNYMLNNITNGVNEQVYRNYYSILKELGVNLDD